MYMQTSPDILAKFQQLYSEEFGEQLSESDALDRLTRLTNVLRILASGPFSGFPGGAESSQAPFDGRRETDTLKSL